MARPRKVPMENTAKPAIPAHATDAPVPADLMAPVVVPAGSNLFWNQVEAEKPAPEPQPEPNPEIITEDEFRAYFAAEVVPTAARFGLVAELKQAETGTKPFAGPTALYHCQTGEMRVFHHPNEVPADYISADDFFRPKK